MITVQGSQMAPNNSVKLQWLLPDGNALFSMLAKTDANGDFTAQVEVRPINATVNGVPSHLQAITSVPVGGIIPSQALKDVINALMVTIFMALLATTAGTIVAGPVSFLAARNIMGDYRSWGKLSIPSPAQFLISPVPSIHWYWQPYLPSGSLSDHSPVYWR